MSRLVYFLRKYNVYLLLIAALLFVVASLINNYLIGTNVANYYTRKLQEDIRQKEDDFRKMASDTQLLGNLIDEKYSEEELHEIMRPEKGYCFFIYEDIPDGNAHRLLFWNTQLALPPLNLMNETDVSRQVLLKNGIYIQSSKIVSFRHRQYRLEALIPVMWKYFVENENLRKEFASFPQAGRQVDISYTPSEYAVKSIYGNTLFYLQRITIQDKESSIWSIILALAGFFVLFWFIHQAAHTIALIKGIWWGVFFLGLAILLLRTATYLFPEILDLRQFELFDPAIYSSSFVLSSLGDLFINALLLSWLSIFINRRIIHNQVNPLNASWINWVLITFLLIVHAAMTFLFAGILQSLVADAQISFNVTNIFSLSWYSVIGFIILASLALTYFFFSQAIVYLTGKLGGGRKYAVYIITGAAGLLMLTFVRNTAFVELNLFVLLWLLLFIWMMHQTLFVGFNFKLNISEGLFWLFIFSFSMAAVIVYENRKIEEQQRVQFAEKLSLQADPKSEKLLSIALAYLDNDFLAPNFNRFREKESNARMKDSIINMNFSAYHNRYDTRIFTFGASKLASDKPDPLFNEDPISFDTLDAVFSIQGKATTIPDLRYFEQSFDEFNYIYRKEVTEKNQVLGYFFILSVPKRYKSDALIPELFKQTMEYLPEYSSVYSYAIYGGYQLQQNYNDYPFPTQLQPDLLSKKVVEWKKTDSYNELWYRSAADKLVVIVKKDNYYLEAITLFAYLFSTFLFLLALYWLASVLIRSRMRPGKIGQFLQLSIRSQIHSTILAVSLLSFLVIGVATILFFIKRYERNNQDRMSRTMQVMVTEVQNKLKAHERFNDGVMLYEPVVNEEVEKLMQDISEIHGSDINLYDPEGNLKVSSNPLIYNKGVLSEKMNPLAYYRLHVLRMIQCITEEKMGKLNYLSVYNPVRNDQGAVYAYLNVPSYSTQGELKQEISNFFVTIINLNAFIFLIAGAIALYITNRITESFTIIGKKMREINLGKMNQEIEWKRDDEIGELVKEYNKMVHKLDDSAEALAKSEREGAWRQMARQVAHEIKNPLTPMKLSIQYLQKAIDNNSPNVKDMTTNVARTLVEQIDHLSKIASDFSQFANIGNPKNEVFDLHEMLSSLASLYEATEKMEFNWEPVDQRVMLFADKTQLNRLFTNLLQNAVEATVGQESCSIRMAEHLNGEYVTISIADNGTGIPEHTWAKIFTPNFTTKSSGTGLGLAMSKSIVENANGEIWFETIEGEGSTFFVKLPVLRALS